MDFDNRFPRLIYKLSKLFVSVGLLNSSHLPFRAGGGAAFG
jgi:hypothetical protein